MRNLKKRLILFSLVLGLCCVSFLQAQTGTLTGIVVDETDVPLPGVEVSISSPELISPQLSQVTGEKGFFRFNFLPPGTYTVRATLSGFAPFTHENIQVQVGLTTDVVVVMRPEDIEEEVIVTAETPLVAIENTKMSTNIGAEEIKALPVGRELTDVFGLAAGVVETGRSGQGVGGATHGAGTHENAFLIDGVYVTDPDSGTLKMFQSLDSYEEVQIETAGHRAEFGNAGGAVVNVVTKSGGNVFSGDVSLFYKSDSLQSTNYQGTGLDAPGSETVSFYDASLSLGGPIVKDKVWFFLSGRYNPETTRVVGFPLDKPTKRFFPLGKITISPSAAHRISLSYNYNYYKEDYWLGSQTIQPETSLLLVDKGHSALFNWFYFLSQSAILEFKVAYLNQPASSTQNTDKVWVYDAVFGTFSGGMNGGSEKQTRLQVVSSLTYFFKTLGDHELKIGGEFETADNRNRVFYNTDEHGNNLYVQAGGFTLFGVRWDPPEGTWQTERMQQISGYLQDTWKINRFISANIGFRLTYADNFMPVQENIDTKQDVASWFNFEPRLGLGIDPFGDGRTSVKFSFSRYSMLLYDWFGSINPNRQTTILRVQVAPGVWFPIQVQAPETGTVDSDLKRPYVNEFFIGLERELTPKLSLRATFVWKDYKQFITTSDSIRTSDLYVPYSVTNPVTNESMTVYDIAPGAPIATAAFFNNDSRANRKYRALVLELEKRYSDNYQFRLSYTWSRNRGTVGQSSFEANRGLLATDPSGAHNWSNPNFLINREGTLGLSRTHVFKFQGVYSAPFGIFLSLSYIGASGTPYTRTFTVVPPNLGIAQEINAEPLGSSRNPFLHNFDIKIQKDFNISTSTLSFFIDVFNLFNSNTTTYVYSNFGSPYYLTPLSIQPARLGQIGVRFTF